MHFATTPQDLVGSLAKLRCLTLAAVRFPFIHQHGRFPAGLQHPFEKQEVQPVAKAAKTQHRLPGRKFGADDGRDVGLHLSGAGERNGQVSRAVTHITTAGKGKQSAKGIQSSCICVTICLACCRVEATFP